MPPDRPPEPPVALALLLADGEYTDAATGRTSIMGLFSVLFAPAAPATVPRLFVFAELTGVRGPTPVSLRIVPAAADAAPVKAEAVTVTAPDPLHVVRVAAYLDKVTFQTFGAYAVQLLAGEELLVERWLTVRPLAHAP